MITPDFLATVVVLSVSGVLGPGPLFVSSTVRATKHGWIAGVQGAVGHTIVEAPMVFALAIGLSSFFTPATAKLIGIPGGIVLFGFAAIQIHQALSKKDLSSSTTEVPPTQDKSSGIFLGVLFTAANPFFLVWWADNRINSDSQGDCARRLGGSGGDVCRTHLDGLCLAWGDSLSRPSG